MLHNGETKKSPPGPLSRRAGVFREPRAGTTRRHGRRSKDRRAIVREKLNARYLRREDIPEKIDLCVIDVSFISLTLILSNAFDLVTPNGVILALIKPQFELQATDVAHGGIVRDPMLHEKAQNKIRDFVINAGHNVT